MIISSENMITKTCGHIYKEFSYLLGLNIFVVLGTI